LKIFLCFEKGISKIVTLKKAINKSKKFDKKRQNSLKGNE
jgi:hypothetical protein